MDPRTGLETNCGWLSSLWGEWGEREEDAERFVQSWVTGDRSAGITAAGASGADHLGPKA